MPRRQPSPPETIAEPLARRWAALLRTRKRDGTWVGTPVNVAVTGERAYFGTPASTWKVRRLRRVPDVELAPCTPRGRPTGPVVRARARLLAGPEADAAARHLKLRHPIVYGILVPLKLRLKRTRGLYYELSGFEAAGVRTGASETTISSSSSQTR